jgi:hypothetical protein
MRRLLRPARNRSLDRFVDAHCFMCYQRHTDGGVSHFVGRQRAPLPPGYSMHDLSSVYILICLGTSAFRRITGASIYNIGRGWTGLRDLYHVETKSVAELCAVLRRALSP